MTKPRNYPRLAFLATLFVCGCNLPLWSGGDPALRPVNGVPFGGGVVQATQKGIDLDPSMQLPMPRTLPPNEQLSLMSQKLANAEDDRKVLAGRLQMVETQLEEKEHALAAAMEEIQDSTSQIVKTRNELQQWQKDMKNLREKYGALEKDNRETLETMIKTLEKYLERDNAAKLPEPGGQEILPLPKHK